MPCIREREEESFKEGKWRDVQTKVEVECHREGYNSFSVKGYTEVINTVSNEISQRNAHVEAIKNLSILYFNARSLKTKMEELEMLVKNKKPDVIAIVESWLNDDIYDSEISIDKYNFVRLDRHMDQKAKGGGVIVYVIQDLIYLQVTSEIITNIDYMWLKIHGKNIKTIIIGVYYRPPDSIEEQTIFSY